MYEKQNALRIIDAMLHMRDLMIYSVDIQVLHDMYSILNENDLGPRNSIHLACALGSKCDLIVTEDTDFKNIKDIKSLKMGDFLRQSSTE